MFANLDGFFWLLAVLGPLLIFQRSLHREVQAVLLLITRREDITVMLFSVLFLPGVLLHEGSHFLVARILGVQTGRFSLLPRPIGQRRLQLGFVETAKTDWARDALIGAAPLVMGGAFVAYAGLVRLQLLELWSGILAGGADTLVVWLEQPDLWLWLYLVVTVSSTMLPSASDRRAWQPIGLILLLLFSASLLAGAGPWMVIHLAPGLNQAMRVVAVVFTISVVVHFGFTVPLWLMHRLLAYLMHIDIC